MKIIMKRLSNLENRIIKTREKVYVMQKLVSGETVEMELWQAIEYVNQHCSSEPLTPEQQKVADSIFDELFRINSQQKRRR